MFQETRDLEGSFHNFWIPEKVASIDCSPHLDTSLPATIAHIDVKPAIMKWTNNSIM